MTKKHATITIYDSLRDLNRVIALILVDGDSRIRIMENRLNYRSVLHKVVSKGFIRTHAIVTNWLIELFENGETTSLTFHEIMDKLPWSWDTTREYFDSLEEEGIVQYSRDSQGRKICTLTIESESRAKQIDNLLKFSKRNETHSLNTISEARKEFAKYNTKLNEWFCMNYKMNDLSSQIKQAPLSTVEKFIETITKIINISKEEDLRLNLLDFLKQYPLLLYSIRKVE